MWRKIELEVGKMFCVVRSFQTIAIFYIESEYGDTIL